MKQSNIGETASLTTDGMDGEAEADDILSEDASNLNESDPPSKTEPRSSDRRNPSGPKANRGFNVDSPKWYD